MLQLFDAYPPRLQVTSDCRSWQGHGRLAVCGSCGIVQKQVDQDWLLEIVKIYNGYNVYAQSQGMEQLSFELGSGDGKARSQKIVGWIKSQASLPKSGLMLDIGCGNGAFLRAFGDEHPQWQLIGSELDDRNRVRIEAIPQVVRFHAGPLGDIQDRFDLIVMIHALEHIPDPVAFLSLLHTMLKPDGLLLVQVPDLSKSPFDILIADHCTHFSKETLGTVVQRSRFQTLCLVDTCVAKELTLLAKAVPKTASSPPLLSPCISLGPPDRDVAIQHIDWLHDLLIQAGEMQAPVGIFGSSISSSWLAAAIGESALFFVDEDAGRVGKFHQGLPIIAPKDVPDKVPILMPIRHDLASSIARRLSSTLPSLIEPPAPPR